MTFRGSNTAANYLFAEALAEAFPTNFVNFTKMGLQNCIKNQWFNRNRNRNLVSIFIWFHFISRHSVSLQLIWFSFHNIIILFHFHFYFYFIFTSHLVSYVVSFCFVSSREMQRTLQWLYTRRALGFIGIIFFKIFCKPAAEAMRKQFGSFAEAGTLISQSDRPAGEFLRFCQISPEAKSLRIRIMRKACGRRSGRCEIMFEFPAEAKPLENRI